jgi:HSP20 family molecular chaperone IbpA
MSGADFEVNFEDGYLVIAGARPDIQERRAYHQMEIRFGRFSVGLGLPGPVNVDESRAEYLDGFVTVTLPKLKPTFIVPNE